MTRGPGAGLVPIQEAMGDAFKYRYKYYPSQYGENDYFLFFLLILGDYYAMTEDIALMQEHWNGTTWLIDTMVNRFLDPNSGLLADPNGVTWFTAQGFQNATAPTALFVIALQELLPVAKSLKDESTAKHFDNLAKTMSNGIQKLWSDKLGTFAIALNNQTDNSILSAAFPIRAGLANTTQATSAVKSLGDLFLNIGYKDSTVISNGATTQLSPNVQGFLLESLFMAHLDYEVPAKVVTPVLQNLLDVYWPKMVNQNEYYTGSSWEYVYADGSPGIGIFTSLNHPWGGAPTYVLTNYILGIRTKLNKATNSYSWVIDPAWSINEGLGLKHATGRMPLPDGGWIEATWTTQGGSKKCEVQVHSKSSSIKVHPVSPCEITQ